jgi:hypothetical protein
VYWPTHGPSIDAPREHVTAFIAHRREREDQIVACVKEGIGVIQDMVPVMYTDTPEFMYPAAARSVLAAIQRLVDIGTLVTDGSIALDGHYRLAH